MSEGRKPDGDELSLETEAPERLAAGDESDSPEQTSKQETAEETAVEVNSDEETAETEPTIEQLQEQVAQLQEEYDREHDLHLRAVAELKNYQRRVAQQQAQQLQYANEALLTELLPVLDHFQLALQSAPAEESAVELTTGVRMIYQQLMDTLAEFGLKPIEAAGEQFNPDRHEAVQRQPVVAGDPQEGKVIEQLRRGYQLHQRVLRPAQVKVGVAAEANTTE